MHQTIKNLFCLAFVALFFIKWGSTQVTVNNNPPYNTVQHMVQNVLLGNGVQAFNIQVYGAPIQYGYFNGAGTWLGIDSGLVMSTGDIQEVPIPPGFGGFIPIGPTSGGFGPPSMGTTGNNDLLSVAQSVPPLINQTFNVTSANDACIIEFDFIATADTVQFKYVFGSDEYLTFINTSYNDVFAFFLSGPGITGPFTSPANMPGGSINLAVVPNSSPPLPITISSVQPGLNALYYVPNIPNQGISVNGFTTVLTAKHPVNACDTFHIRLALADGTDHSLSSFVFLEANSFKSKGITVIAKPTYNTIGGDSSIYEGCGGATITFKRTSNLQRADTVYFSLGGTATNGVDYSPVPNFAIFPQNADSVSIFIQVFNDNITEIPETFSLFVTSTTVCTSSGTDSVTLTFYDPLPILNQITNDTTINCTQSNIPLQNTTSGLIPFKYLWNNGDTLPNLTVSPSQTSTYIVTITDACLIDSKIDSVTVSVITPPFITSLPPDTIDCSIDSVLVGPIITNNYNQITYYWSNGSTDSAIWVKSNVDTTVTLITMLNCANLVVHDTFNLRVKNPPYSLSMKNDTTNCTIDSIIIGPQVNGIIKGFTYLWENGKTDSAIWVSPTQTQNFKVVVTDACGLTKDSIANTIFLEKIPMGIQVNSPIFDCYGDTVTLTANAYGGYPGYKYLWDFGGTSNIEQVVPNTSRIYRVRATDTCAIDTATAFVQVTYRSYPTLVINNIPSMFLNCPGDTLSLGPATVSGGSGDFEVSWDNWKTTVDTLMVSTDTTKHFLVKARDLCDLDSAKRIVTVAITQHKPLKIQVTDDLVICPDQTVDLFATPIDGAGFFTYLWSNRATDSTITVSPPYSTAYSVTITDDCGNQVKDNIRVRISEPQARFNYEYIDEKLLRFGNFSKGEIKNVWWYFGNGDTTTVYEPLYSYPIPNTYQVKLVIEDIYGCFDSTFLEIQEPLQYFPPTAFSPNGDGLNDLFFVEANGVKAFRMYIYNRWGGEIFHSTNPANGWDGTINGQPLPADVYIYRIEIEGYNKQAVEKMGTVMLVR